MCLQIQLEVASYKVSYHRRGNPRLPLLSTTQGHRGARATYHPTTTLSHRSSPLIPAHSTPTHTSPLEHPTLMPKEIARVPTVSRHLLH